MKSMIKYISWIYFEKFNEIKYEIYCNVIRSGKKFEMLYGRIDFIIFKVVAVMVFYEIKKYIYENWILNIMSGTFEKLS